MDPAELLSGVVLLSLLWIKIPSRRLLIPITILATAILAIPYSIQYLRMDWPEWVILWAIAGTAFIVIYILRFREKTERRLIDVLKLTAVILVAIYPGSWFIFSDPEHSTLVIYGIHILAFTIYFYDRMILSNQNRRIYIAVFIAQTVLIVMFFVYALVQRTQADKARMAAEDSRMQAEEQMRLCEERLRQLKNP